MAGEKRSTISADVVIVGAGSVGSAVARMVSRYSLSSVLLERESDVCCGTSKANNAHIVCGADITPGLIETGIVVRSNGLYDKVTGELGVPYRRIGNCYAALTEDEVKRLEGMRDNALKNGVNDVKIISRDEVLDMEPHLTREVRAGLWVPRDGIVSPYTLAIALCENAARNGVKILTNQKVEEITVEDGAVRRVVASDFVVNTRMVINCAGLFADEISAMVGWDGFKLHPRRGEFFILDRKFRHLVNHIMYPLPNPVSRGATICPTIDDNVLIGPTAVDVTDKFDRGTTAEGLQQVMGSVSKYYPEIKPWMAVTQYAGLRPAGAPDFIIGRHPGVAGFINAAAIRSTGISACLGIADRVRELMSEVMELRENPGYNPVRAAERPFRDLSVEEKDGLIAKDARFGRVVCRCETVTEGEILGAIHCNPPARDLDSVKRRTRAGMGRCQAGFCRPRVMEILSRETGTPMTGITLRGPGSEVLTRPTKKTGGKAGVKP